MAIVLCVNICDECMVASLPRSVWLTGKIHRSIVNYNTLINLMLKYIVYSSKQELMS